MSDDAFYRLFQEDMSGDPFRMVVACVLVNVTPWSAAQGPHAELMDRWPTPETMATADVSEVSYMYRTANASEPPFRCLDLFSGIGGFSLGLEATGGFETVAFCEVDPFCRRVLARRWPKARIYDDVRSVDERRLVGDGLPVPDVICGGFPCQDISVAGRGVGIDGPRSGLWTEFARLVGDLRPRYAIVENVAAIASGRGLDRVLGDLTEVGYDAEWHLIPASAVGAPQERDRCWVVSYPQGTGQDGEREEGLVRGPPSQLGRLYRVGGGRLGTWDEPEPRLVRMADGLPEGLDDRLRCLGNAVVPRVVETIGNAILWREGRRGGDAPEDSAVTPRFSALHAP